VGVCEQVRGQDMVNVHLRLYVWVTCLSGCIRGCMCVCVGVFVGV